MSEEAPPKKRKFKVEDPSSGGRLKSFVVTIIIIAIIIMAAVAVGVRTEFFKDWYVDYLERQYGKEVDFTVGKIAIGFPYNFVVEELQAKGADNNEKVALYIKRFESPLYLLGRKVYIFEGADLSLEQRADGVWSPGILAKLGEMNELDTISAMTREVRDDLSIEIRNGSVSWWGSNGQTQRQADGIHFYMAPHDIKGRDLTYYELKARLLSGARTTASGFVDEAWLATDTKDKILLYSGKDAPPSPVTTPADSTTSSEGDS